MDQKHARYVFLGLAIGTAMGILFGAASGNPVLGMGVGALAGVFVGWFVAAAMQRWQREKDPGG